ncbi:MAG: glycosyltransferase family 2 protein [Candidatus Pacebacteria bacterium]|nr:glycosyltransferase family 2 protein [Candidatus Paceibacterota bacterium]
MLSVIIPVLNEAENLAPLHRELTEVLSRLHQAAEILFVDDASADTTPDVIRELQGADPRVRGFRLTQNSDKGGALLVGFREARGNVCITLDGDLQNDPADIPLLLAALEQGANLALGRRMSRADSSATCLASRLFNACMSMAFRHRLYDANTGYKVLRRETALSAPLAHGLFRFLPFILARRGLKIIEVPVHHRPRANGKSRFGTGRRLFSLLKLPRALRAAQKPLKTPEELPAYIALS